MANDILIRPGDGKMEFSGSSANYISLDVQADGEIRFTSASTLLFSINDTALTGSVFSGSFVGDGTSLTGAAAAGNL